MKNLLKEDKRIMKHWFQNQLKYKKTKAQIDEEAIKFDTQTSLIKKEKANTMNSNYYRTKGSTCKKYKNY